MPALAQTSLTADERVYLTVPESVFDAMIISFVRWLLHPPASGPLEKVWNGFVFALIALGGVCGDDAFEAICMMRVRDVLQYVDAGCMWVPRLNAAVPIYVNDLVALASLRLIAHMSRNGRGGRNRRSACPVDSYLLPIHRDSAIRPTSEEIKCSRAHFEEWLKSISKTVAPNGPAINIQKLLRLARCRLSRIYSPLVAGSLIGNHLYSPTVNSPRLLDSYRAEFHMPVPVAHLDSMSSNHRDRRPDKSQAGFNRDRPSDITNIICSLRKKADPYCNASSKQAAKQIRRSVVESLNELAAEYKQALMPGTPALDVIYRERIAPPNPNHTLAKTAIFNGACVARWLADSVRTKMPNTARGRLNDIVKAMRYFVGQCLIELSHAEIAAFVHSCPSRKSKLRMQSTLNRFRHYAISVLKLNVSFPPMSLAAPPHIEPLHCLSMEQFAQVIGRLMTMGREGEAAAVSAMFGAFFGLRISETVALILSDVWLARTPTVYIFETKRTSRRVVVGIEIPEEPTVFLREFVRKRLAEAGGDRTQPLLTVGNRPVTEEKVGRLIAKATAACGIKGSHHDLRHLWVNRLLARGIPLAEIGHLAHHASLETTVSSYTHVLPLLQREQLDQYNDPILSQPECCYVPVSSLGKLLGMSDRGVTVEHVKVCGIGLLPESDVKPVRHPGQCGHCIRLADAVRFIAGRLL